MSWPTSISTPRRWRTSRLRAAASVSASSTRPPGNSQRRGRTAAGRRWGMGERPWRSVTAAATRVVRSDDDDSIRISPRSHVHAEELLAHQEHVAAHHLGLATDAQEGAVGAAEVGEEDLPALGRDAAVQAGDVAVLGEEDVAALAA